MPAAHQCCDTAVALREFARQARTLPALLTVSCMNYLLCFAKDIRLADCAPSFAFPQLDRLARTTAQPPGANQCAMRRGTHLAHHGAGTNGGSELPSIVRDRDVYVTWGGLRARRTKERQTLVGNLFLKPFSVA